MDIWDGGLRLGIKITIFEFGDQAFRIWIEDWDWGLGLGIGIGD